MNPYPSKIKANFKQISLSIYMLCCSLIVRGQASIISISPSTVQQGDQHQVVIKGLRTHFKQGTSKVDLGQGVQVLSASVPDQETIILQMQVDNTATPGSRNLLITTGAEIVGQNNALQVINSSAFNTSFTLYPAQYLSTAYFDPKHIQSSPQLFTINIANNAVNRDLTLLLTIISQDFGNDPIITGTSHFSLLAGTKASLNNRQFSYTFASTAMEPFETSSQTGNLPGGIYNFRLQVFDKGNIVSDNSAVIQISNPMDKPELLYPGHPFSNMPMQIQSRQPLFQWIGQGTAYDISIYPVLPGQVSGEEAVINRPVFEEKNINTNSFLYPAFALPLEEGKTYAWQISTHNYGATSIKSEVKWFTVHSTAMPVKSINITRIMVAPEDITLKPSAKFHFTINALNEDKDTIQVRPIWKVVPSDAGVIDEDGNFTAGKEEKMAVAIVAIYAEQTDYVTLNIKYEVKKKKKLQ